MTTPTASTTPADAGDAADEAVDDLVVVDDANGTSTDDAPGGAEETADAAVGGGLLGRVTGFFTAARLRAFLQELWPPVLGVGAFLALWAILAPRVDTQLGQLPGPAQVWDAAVGLYDAWQATRAEEAAFYANQEIENAARLTNGEPTVNFEFNGSPTFLDQIWTSLRTVALGFFIGTVVAVPIGLLAGLSSTFSKAINPLVQILKPVSPLAWLPIVTMIISATVTSADPLLPKAFLTSAIVVTLCSVWPTLINTSVGAGSVDKDLLNVAEVLRLGWFTRLRKIVLPSALPYIFTGMRLSLGVGWMVLIAAEMLAQNPGLGKFVWDEYQNSSSQSLSRIMVAVIVIGIIGFLLDRMMAMLESFVSSNRVTS
ncbi:MAG: ABC transporter permease [Actinomycetota bacterium]